VRLPESRTLARWIKIDVGIAVLGLLIGTLFTADVLHLLVVPFRQGSGQDVSLFAIKALGSVSVRMHIAVFCALLLTLPLLAIQLYTALLGVKANLPVLGSLIAFLMGCLYFYSFYFPLKLSRVLSAIGSDSNNTVPLMPDIEGYLHYLMPSILIQGLIFQGAWLVAYTVHVIRCRSKTGAA